MASKNEKIELGWSFPKRKKLLDDLSKKSTGRTYQVDFQNKDQDFAIHSIPIGLPKYRIDNGRTYAAQAKYLSNPDKKDLPKDFFLRDFESEQVQQAQHDILKGMINEKSMSSFFKKNKQSGALILSHDGFVINGNRRLCAWREHLASNPKKYTNFKHIDVVILPPADPKDIDELEAKLQVHRDIKAEYTWTSLALMFRNRQASHGYTPEGLAELFDMSKPNVEELTDMLLYAEAYLEDRNKVGEYDLVDNAEYAFRQLHKKRSKIKGESYKDVFEKISFCLIDNGRKEGRLYQAVPGVADNLSDIIEKIEEEFDVPEAEETEGIKLLGGQPIASLSGILKIAEDKNNYEKIRTIALDVIEAENVKRKEQSKRDFVHAQVKKANTALVEAVTAIDKKTKKEGISAQIKSIENSLIKIKEWLKDEN